MSECSIRRNKNQRNFWRRNASRHVSNRINKLSEHFVLRWTNKWTWFVYGRNCHSNASCVGKRTKNGVNWRQTTEWPLSARFISRQPKHTTCLTVLCISQMAKWRISVNENKLKSILNRSECRVLLITTWLVWDNLCLKWRFRDSRYGDR